MKTDNAFMLGFGSATCLAIGIVLSINDLKRTPPTVTAIPTVATPAPAIANNATTASWFNDGRWGCASNTYATSTMLQVEYHGRFIVVPVLGSGPFESDHKTPNRTRGIDLSKAAFAALADTRLGLITVTIEPLK